MKRRSLTPMMLIFTYISIIFGTSLMVYLAGAFGVLLTGFMAIFIPSLWSGNAKFSLFLFLAVFMPLFPTNGFILWGRSLDWFDGLILIVGLWNGFHIFSNRMGGRWDLILTSSSFFLSILLILSITSPYPEISLREFVSYFVNFFLTYWIMDRLQAGELKIFLGALFSSSCIVGCVAIWQKFNNFSFPSTMDGEVTIRLGVPGTFEDSLVLSMYAGVMLIFIVMGWFRYKTTGFRILCVVALCFNLLSLNLALSRNGIFIVGAACLFFLILRFFSWIKNRRLAMKIPLVFMSLPIGTWIGIKLLPEDLYHRIVSAFYLFSGSNDPIILYNIRSTLGRFENYKEAIKIFLESPVDGIGLGLYPILTRFEDADGFYTGLLAETGLVGSLAFLFFAISVVIVIFRSLRVIWRQTKTVDHDSHGQMLFYELFAGLCFAYFVTSFFEPLFKIQMMSFLFFFFLKLMSLEYGTRNLCDGRTTSD